MTSPSDRGVPVGPALEDHARPGAPPLSAIVRGLPTLVPFIGPEAQERVSGVRFRARLGANESHYGPSPRAIAALTASAVDVWKYCDPENFDLRTAIAALHGVAIDNVVIGEGIDGLLGLAVKLATDGGDVVVTSDGAYPTFNFHVTSHGARLVKVPFRADHEDHAALMDAVVQHQARVLYVSNPNNPMGTWWPAGVMQRLIDALPPGVLLLFDEAYCDTAPAGTVPPLDIAHPQVLRLRTFSKAYGLAGARIGYAVGHAALIGAFEKVRNHYGINRSGQIAAQAAIEDQAHLAAAVAAIAQARGRIAAIARASGLTPIASAANFVAIDCGADGAFAARVLAALLANGVFARKPQVAGLDRCIRVSCGADGDLDVFAEVLPLALDVARRGTAPAA